MFVSNVAYILQPLVAQPEAAILQSRFHSPASEMATNNDVSNLQHVDSVLNHGKTIRIIQCDHIRNVAMYKKLARQESDDFICWHATIRAPNPQVLRLLLPRKPLEKSRIARRHPRDPLPIVLEKMIQSVHHLKSYQATCHIRDAR
jgi:hypothetical protein